MKKFSILILSLFISISYACADEGMWLLKELNKQSIARMQELGFTFPVNKIYNEKSASLKDAVVIFGGGCTGVTVSNQGLIFTNHHCGYGNIQKLSSVEHDYLKNGFSSQSFSEELPAEGLKISYLSYTKDITKDILKNITEETKETDRRKQVDSLSSEYLKKFENDEFISAKIVPFYSANKYYLVVYDVFKDVRLVFTPPSSVGKFGGETDNWMWPRQTGDFSVFRVYADKNNKPANYSENNRPYSPKYHVPISIQGYEENGYAMTIGYPGSTQRYIPSWGVENMVENVHKPRIEVRGVKQAIWKEEMYKNDTVRIKYASKYAGSSNYWKNAIGMNSAIKKLNVIGQKQDLENQFNNWVNQNASRSKKYNNTLNLMQTGYSNIQSINKTTTYFNEVFFSGIEFTSLGVLYKNAANSSDDKLPTIVTTLNNFYKDYEPRLDKTVAVNLLELYAKNVNPKYYPSIYEKIKDEFGGDYQTYIDWLFKNSNILTPSGLNLVANNETSEILNDPVVEFSESVVNMSKELRTASIEDAEKITQGNRQYMAGLMEMNPNKTFSPDANFTQRLSYGSIKPYSPADAVEYNYYTTVKGVLEKVDPLNPEFNLQEYIIKDLESNDFGQYADKDGKMHVNFISTNDITGGNSGSPVFNGQAQLIGLAFDGNWDALSGDIVFNNTLQRSINVDIRYVLYIIDKVGNCHRLIEEIEVK